MERRLLAALLCRPNAIVSIEDLVMALWGEQEPPTARKTLQVYVRRLRTTLGEDRIFHQPGGYRIAIAPGELDSDEFADLVKRDRLGEALELWHGAAFEDVREHPPIAEVARRLDEERIQAQARHAESRLAEGHHAELVPHLTQLIEAHPYHEDLRSHLMLALYRSGRQTEALDLFLGTRKMLAEDLGVEPGPGLRRLHAAILRADPELDLPAEPSKSPNATVPRELPATISGFAGRTAQLRALDGMLHDSSPVVISAIAGSGGVGKTSLAVQWAHTVTGHFPDGQLYVNLRGFDPAGQPVTATQAIRRFLGALGVTPQQLPADAEAQAAMYRSLLADKRMLVMLDNARDAAQVRPLLPGSPSCLVLLTSRNRLASLVATSGARSLMLDVLSLDEARQLLAARLGTTRVLAEPTAVDEIIRRCARLPLALAIASARALTQPEQSLASIAESLDAFADSDDDPLTDLRAVFSWSYRQLGPAAAQLFRLLGLHPGPDISERAADSLAGHPAGPMLAELLGAHLISRTAPGRYGFHDLLRAYAAELAGAEEGDATRRMLDHYLHTGYPGAVLLSPSREPIAVGTPLPQVVPEPLADEEQAMAWFAAEHRVLLAAIRHAAATGRDTDVWQLTWVMTSFLDRQGHWDDWVWAQQATLAAVERLGDLGLQARAARGMAAVYLAQGHYDDAHAHVQRALDLYGQIGDSTGQAFAHHNLSWLLGRQERYTEALEHAQHALKMYEAVDNRVWQARALNAVGWYHTLLGAHLNALEYCQRALVLLRELDEREGVAMTLDSLGHAHHQLGEYGQAASCHQEALGMFREMGDRYYEAVSLARLGDTVAASGSQSEARVLWEQAAAIFTELNHPKAEEVLAKLGSR
jgi:DNA-binding SARP family transcriptional activator/predicted negative regulator of RcsB-dependent stress response